MRFAYPPYLSDVLVVFEPFLGLRVWLYGSRTPHEMTGYLTIEILREIRDGIGALGADFDARLDQTSERLDQTNQRVDQTKDTTHGA